MSEPVPVVPIPAEQSTTLRLNKRWALWTPIAAIALTILDILMQMFADPTLAPLIAKYLPMELRVGVTAVVWILARQNWKKRFETAQPIINSEGESKARRLFGIALICLLAVWVSGCASAPEPSFARGTHCTAVGGRGDVTATSPDCPPTTRAYPAPCSQLTEDQREQVSRCQRWEDKPLLERIFLHVIYFQ